MSSSVGVNNAWRLESTVVPDRKGSPRAGATRRYFVVDTDSHVNEPANVYELGGIDLSFTPRLPRIEVDTEGNQWRVAEGTRRALVKPASAQDRGDEQSWSDKMEADDLERVDAGSTKHPDEAGLERRRRDAARDGIDAQVVFPNRGLLAYATADALFSTAMCRAWNRWVFDVYGDAMDRFAPMALLAPALVDEAIADVVWAASKGFRGVSIPCRPRWGANDERSIHYNAPDFDRLWAALQDAALPVTIHVATGRDPREASGQGGAVINLVMGSLSQTMEPLAYLLASGVFERYPRLRVGTVEGGIGWIPWLLASLDDATRRHHMWVNPVLRELPSHYYRTNCFSTFVEDRVGISLAEDHGLIGNVTWSSDYPHQEGSWPHSAEAIERQMGSLSDENRARVLGLNAAEIFGFDATLRAH